jgi:hypothetical protein
MILSLSDELEVADGGVQIAIKGAVLSLSHADPGFFYRSDPDLVNWDSNNGPQHR